MTSAYSWPQRREPPLLAKPQIHLGSSCPALSVSRERALSMLRRRGAGIGPGS